MKKYDYPIYLPVNDSGEKSLFLCSVEVLADDGCEDHKNICSESLEKINRINSVLKNLRIYFYSNSDFKDWLLTRNAAFDSRPPVDLIKEEIELLERACYEIDTGGC